jgi:tetratricopeptide (TPR) repeat protein
MLFETATALLGSLTPAERTSMQFPAVRDGRAYNLYLRGVSLLREGDPESLPVASQFLERALALDPTSADTHVSLAAVYNSRYFLGIEGGQANFDSARAHSEAAADLDPTSPSTMRALTNLEWMQERGLACLAIGQRALTVRPRTLELQTVAAQAYTLGGLCDCGLDLCRRVLSADPSNSEARYFAVLAAAWGQRSEDALEEGAEFVRRFGEEPEVYLWMAVAATRLGQRSKALELVKRAYDVAGDRGDPRTLLIGAAVEQSLLGARAARPTWEHFRELLLSRLAVSPGQIRIRFQLMFALTMLGRQREALEQWEQVRSAFTADRVLGINEGYGYAPYLLVRLGRRDEAARLIEMWTRGGLGWSKWAAMDTTCPVPQALGGLSDSMLVAFRAAQRARMAEAAIRFRPPPLD